MNSCFYFSKLYHERFSPKKNSFKYGIYLSYLDLDELADLQKTNYLFNYNKKNILSFWDDDHFTFLNNTSAEAIIIANENNHFDVQKYKNKNTKERIKILAKELGLDFEIEKVFLLTNLRNFGYVFNPVSFYYCFDKNGVFRVLFSEINNTFLDQKMYYMVIDDASQKSFTSRQRKNYYISPFISYENDLRWRFNLPQDDLIMNIDSLDGETIILKTNLIGQRKEFNNKNLSWAQLRYPLMTIFVIILIHFQAIKLFFKKIPYYKKNETDDIIAGVIKKNTKQ
ncbi:MAG: DUF1365 domain-containing protein [Candidatus Falkowbacteria bacterium]